MRKIVVGLLCLSILITANGQKSSNYTYIMLEYGGEIDKPLPLIIFYIDSFDMSSSLLYVDMDTPPGSKVYFGKAYKVSNCEFASIEVVILENKLVVKADTSDFDYYNFTIARNGQKLRYVMTKINKTGLIDLFDEILKKIEDPGMRENVNYGFYDTKLRMR